MTVFEILSEVKYLKVKSYLNIFVNKIFSKYKLMIIKIKL